MEKSCNFSLKDIDYTVNKPMIGDLISIEENKAIFTNGRYGAIMANRTIASQKALDNIDMMAIITTLCPLLIANLKVNTWKELSLEDFNELKVVYDTKIDPWYSSITEPMKGKLNKEDG